MDIAQKLKSSVRELPEGEYTQGLAAIIRHVDAAIGHYDRAYLENDDDGYTDCIYRTNQVYEGSLKEAYRIISGSAPEGKSLFEIEKYFDGNKKIRSRVITQMSRYRQDYRNPSTHDYKLDFDENEALLAILSVSGFAKLLVSQMKSKLEADTLRSDPDIRPNVSLQNNRDDVAHFCLDLANSLLNFLNNETANQQSHEPLALVRAYLEKSKLDITYDVYVEASGSWYEWDMLVKNKAGSIVPIEVKTSRGRYSREITFSRVQQVVNFAIAGDFNQAILVEGAGRGSPYTCSKISQSSDVTVYRLGREINLADPSPLD